MLAGGSGSKGVSQNRHSPGCPAAVRSTAGEETSSHLEEIWTENICVKNKKDKNRNTKKEETSSFAQHVQPLSRPLVPFKVRGICTRSAMSAPGAAPRLAGSPLEGFVPAASEVTLKRVAAVSVLLQGEDWLSPDTVPGLWEHH